MGVEAASVVSHLTRRSREAILMGSDSAAEKPDAVTEPRRGL